MDIRKSMLGLLISVTTSFVVALCIILLWGPISAKIAGINVGLFMLFSAEVWEFIGFYAGLVFIVGLVVTFAWKSRFRRRPE